MAVEVAATSLAVGLATALNSAVRGATGKSIAQNCSSLLNKVRSKVLGTVVDVKAKQLAEDAWKKAEDRITGLERNERLAFSQRLAALGKTLWNLEANPIVEDEGVKGALDGLRGSLERAVEGTDDAAARGRASADIQGYAQNLSIAMTAASAKRSDASAAASANRSASFHAESMDGINDIKTMVAKFNKDEPANQARYAYEPYDYNDTDQVASLLGEGSFGSTHTMKNADDGQIYAVKLINIRKAKNEGITEEMMMSEAARLSMLSHDNIVRYFTAFRFGQNKKFYAIAMQLLTGGSLKELLQAAAGPLTSDTNERALATEKWTTEVASALAYMHAKGVQHRDLKPNNVLFDEFGAAKIMDLGLAVVLKDKSCVSSAGGANKVGALNYQSPEKAKGQRYDGKDDIWALGCMLGGAVTGRLMENRCAGVFALDPDAVKALVDESNAASVKFGGLVARCLRRIR